MGGWEKGGRWAAMVLACALPGCRLEVRRAATAAEQAIPTNARPGAMVISDFDGDGAPDVAVVTSGSGAPGDDGGVELLLNDGWGDLAPPIRLVAVPDPVALHAFDEDRDGAPELSVSFGAAPLDARTLVLARRDDGGFAPPEALATGWISSVSVGDLDGDGLVDLAVAGEAFAPTPRFDATGVYLQRADGESVRAAGVASLKAPLALDWDLDGVVDLVDIDGGSLVQLRADEEGRFGEAHRLPLGMDVRRIALLDVDDDGLQDVIALGADGRTLLTVRAHDDYRLGSPTATVLDGPVRLGGTLAHDGKLGVYLVEEARSRVLLLEALGDGRFVPWGALPTKGPAAEVASGDLDGDGALELIVAEEDPGRIRILPLEQLDPTEGST